MARTTASPSTAIVRLELRAGTARPAAYEVGDGGFLVGGVPGCDLRLPGTNIPPVVCLIARHATGASLRKLAPVMPISVNGRATSSTYLQDGDTIHLGNAELVVRIQQGAATTSPLPDDWQERLANLTAREKHLEQQRQELEAARVILHKRQEEFEAICQQKFAEIEQSAQQVQVPQQALLELEARQAELDRQQAEIDQVRQQLHTIRQELSQRYQDRRDRLLSQQQAIRRAARKIQKRKLAVEQREARVQTLEAEWTLRQAELEASREQIDRERQLVEEQHRLFASRQQEVQRDLHARLTDLEQRESALIEERQTLEKGQKQHQSDLVRLDRIQAGIEQRQKLLNERALEIDRKFEQLQRDTRDLEEQAQQLDEWHTRLTAEAQQLETRKTEVEEQISQLDQRASALEGQQAMLATLRTRLERMREELRRQEQSLSDQRALQEASEADLKQRLDEAEQLREGLLNDRQLFEEERRRFEERRTTLDEAVAQLRLAQETLTQEQLELQARQQQLDATAAEQSEQAARLVARGEQLDQLHTNLQAERQAIRQRETTLGKAEQMLATLQEQVRRRVEELDAREKQVLENEEALARKQAEQTAQAAQTEALHQQAAAELEELRQQLEAQALALEQRSGELAKRAEELLAARNQHEELAQLLDSQRQGLSAERIAFELERQAAQEHERQVRDEFQRAREEAETLTRRVGELDLRASSALERLARGRDQLREHLAEVHTYARQSRDDLETARRHLQADIEKVRQQELELEVARDEHRLAVAAFRQQLIEWQGKVGEMRQSLQLGSSQLELRQAELDARAREVASTTARLVEESQQLERERQAVAERRGEMDRHLSEMREWYRKKLRELAGVDAPLDEEPGEGDVVPMPTPAPGARTPLSNEQVPVRAVLTLNDEIDPADRQLGELLASLELVDADTLHALWAEARRQRRSLRQLLLAGGYLTLYQMALIEAGNLDGLVLGPVRVIDKLPSTPREAVYRVFDPRRNVEAILRHLSEAEMQDAVHPDEFKQRFAAAASVQHNHVAAVLEVSEIAGRPAALLEWVNGLPATDWPGLISAPGVWYRLTCQAALALQAIHSAGLVHGHLEGSSFLLTSEGILKLVGLGEPHWLGAARSNQEEESSSADLLALGRLAAGWANTPATGKASKPKPLPADLQAILTRMQDPEGYSSAQALLEELEQVGSKIQGTTTAWDRLLRHIREQVPPTGTRQSA